jgi:hypothetical protein
VSQRLATIPGIGVAALATLDPDILQSYRLLCGRTVALALDRGAIDGTTAARIRDLLAQA